MEQLGHSFFKSFRCFLTFDIIALHCVTPMNRRLRKLKDLAGNQKQTSDHACKADKIPTHREVIVNGGVEIDGLKEFSDNYKATHKDDTTHDSRDYKLALISTVLIAVYATLTLLQVLQTSKAVKAARDANKLTEDSIRAEMVITNFEFLRPVTAGQRIGVKFLLKNIGRSQAVYGSATDSQRWFEMPTGDMPINITNISTPLEQDVPVKQTMFESQPATQDYIDMIPTLGDDIRARTAGRVHKLTTYFFGKLVYDSVGRRREREFCIYIVRSDSASEEVGLPKVPGDPNFIFLSCPRWNVSHDNYQAKE